LLEDDASHIEVFVWDDDLVPYNDSVWTAKNPTEN